MEGQSSPRIVLALLSLFLALHPAQASAAGPLARRQYDNTEIEVDQSKHDEQFFNFVTRPDIDAPRWNVKIHDEDAIAPGYWFMTAYGIVEQTDNDKAYVGPYIYDSKGDLVWSGAPLLQNYAAFDFKVSTMYGEPLLSFIYPEDGMVYLLNNSYETKKAIWVGRKDEDGEVDRKTTNIHDFQIFGDSYGMINRKIKELDSKAMNKATGYDGACRVAFDGFREVDLETNKVIFNWSPENHLPLTDSYTDPKKCNDAWDYIHFNSIDKFPDGDYLISGRHAYTVYKISHKDKSVVWKLDGPGVKKSDFEWLNDGHFLGQHDARLLKANETHTLFSVMDNAIGPGDPRYSSEFSRGLVIGLRHDVKPMTAEVISTFNHPEGRYASARGNTQILPNNNAFIGWSNDALHSEHTPDGKCILEASLPSGLKTYRSYKFPWTGRPSSPPDVKSTAVDTQGSILTTVYVSWNGATDIASWNLYKTNKDGDAKELVASRQKDGFETALTHRGFASYVMLEAVDSSGNRLGISKATKTTDPNNPLAPDVIAENQWQTEHTSTTGGSGSVFHAFQNPALAFFSGIIFCAAALLSAWTFWNMRRKGVPSWWQLSNPYQRLSYTSEGTDEEGQVEKQEDEEDSKETPPKYQDDSTIE